MTVTILEGNCLDTLKSLPANSVQCVVTSPPYYGLRDYGTPPHVWGGDPECAHDWHEYIQPAANGILHDGGMSGETLSGNSGTRQPKKSDFCSICGAWRGNYGLEPSPELYVEHTVLIFREVFRVLKDDGTLWLNLGDSYAGSGKGFMADGSVAAGKKQSTNKGSVEISEDVVRSKRMERGSGRWGGGNIPATGNLKPKDLIGIPWMVAFALRADGWYLRQDIIWNKPNPMPESVNDRCTKSHEYIFLFSKSRKYYFDQESILEPVSGNTHARVSQNVAAQIGSFRANGGAKTNGPMKAVIRTPKQQAAGSGIKNNDSFNNAIALQVQERNKRSVWTVTTKPYKGAHFATYPPDLIEPCILAGTKEGDTVLDPFNGSGTTGAVAIKHHRNYIGCELNPKYIKLTNRRLSQVQPVLIPVSALTQHQADGGKAGEI